MVLPWIKPLNEFPLTNEIVQHLYPDSSLLQGKKTNKSSLSIHADCIGTTPDLPFKY